MRIALAQIWSTRDPSRNLREVERAVEEAAGEGASLVVFPEATMTAFGSDLAAAAEPLDGPWASAVRELAARLDVTIVVGTFTPGRDGRVRNTLLVAGPAGEQLAAYDKVHLFDAFGHAESDSVEGGDEAVTVSVGGGDEAVTVSVGGGRGGVDGRAAVVGLATCYDLRFPALFLANAAAGAEISVVAASWGDGPGKVDQWQLLTRARAADSTTFVVAVGQADPTAVAAAARASGDAETEDAATAAAASASPTGVGHSLVASPFGAVVAELGAAPGILVVDLDLDEVAAARRTLPVLANQRFAVASRPGS
ncbi:carbon-nitrogen hydrolase family protein [Frigoribacterium sp. ACAM 257]|uniref:carbon-nitrogen hydrolase family protein n=1 Tax=Frigoribacterium sp. ACAM 257 TaxID=2508998 RepID=UPI0011BA31F3|nr:carbon-nitrogen hydrolase family protein [Frigoribacterium sp. ACAM 257]TWX37026.1 carbon-nitrogen hydrolase family protein [Frigoribacterium sp. ACAM 257]